MENKLKKHLFVGDLHGNVKKFEAALEYARAHEMVLVCVGDYVDSFTYTRNAEKILLQKMIDAYVPDETIYLIGNHDLHYSVPVHGRNDFMCSGYASSAHYDLFKLYSTMYKKGMLRMFYRVGNVFSTHAGVGSDVLRSLKKDPDAELKNFSIDEVNELFEQYEDDFYYYLMSSGNRSMFVHGIFEVGWDSGNWKNIQGGIFWLRPKEYKISRDTSTFLQIVGHTPIDQANGAPLLQPRMHNDSLYVIDTEYNKTNHVFVEYEPVLDVTQIIELPRTEDNLYLKVKI